MGDEPDSARPPRARQSPTHGGRDVVRTAFTRTIRESAINNREKMDSENDYKNVPATRRGARWGRALPVDGSACCSSRGAYGIDAGLSVRGSR